MPGSTGWCSAAHRRSGRDRSSGRLPERRPRAARRNRRRACDADRIADEPGDGPDLRAELDELQATPPDEFVAARNALVKRLRAEKRRAEATEVAALRKPPRAVWALNRLALSDDPHLADLLDAIDAVAGADAAGYREAVGALRDRIGDTVDAAVAGVGAPRPDDHPEVMAALQAVLGDPGALALLVDGRLAEVPTGGLGALGLLPGPPAGGTERAPRPSGRARPKLGIPRAPVADDEEGEDDEAREDEVAEGQADADVDESLAERRRAKVRERLERELVAAVTARDQAATALAGATSEREAAADALAVSEDEVASAEAALAEARARRDEEADALTAAEAAEQEAAAADEQAAEREAAARAALVEHGP